MEKNNLTFDTPFPDGRQISVITPLNYIHSTLPGSYNGNEIVHEKDVAVKQENGSDDGYGSNQFDASSSNSGQSGTKKEAFNPATHHFSPEELKPTPIQRKSRKTLVRDEDKDEKYWDKRRKNNMAAKRSREARRSRENQISLRASYLEKDNAALKEELLNVKEELQSLRETLLIAQQQSELQQVKCQSQNVLLNNN